jgi:hypothetical protein
MLYLVDNSDYVSTRLGHAVVSAIETHHGQVVGCRGLVGKYGRNQH